MKNYVFEFVATESGYGVVSANNEEEARKKILNDEYDDIIDIWDKEIKEITKIEEE